MAHWTQPTSGDSVCCLFPYSPSRSPGLKPRPALVVSATEHEDGVAVTVVYGAFKGVRQSANVLDTMAEATAGDKSTTLPSAAVVAPAPVPAAGAQTLALAGEGRRLYLRLNGYGYGCQGNAGTDVMGSTSCTPISAMCQRR
jgi:hypothetical protein